MSTFSFSEMTVSTLSLAGSSGVRHWDSSLPRSRMLKTPLTVLLVLLCLVLLSLGEAGASSMAESILLRLASVTSADIVNVSWGETGGVVVVELSE